MTKEQYLFLARVIVDGSRRREGYSEEFIEIIEGVIALGRKKGANGAVVLLESELVRRTQMHTNYVPQETNAVKRFLASA